MYNPEQRQWFLARGQEEQSNLRYYWLHSLWHR